MDINIRKTEEREKFQDARPRIQEVAVRVGLSKALFYWQAISRWALILLAALAPIFFLPFTNLPVAVHKELLIFILILAAFFALLGRILIEGRMRYPGHLLMTALLFLILAWGVSAFFSVNQIGSLIGSWATPDSFFAMLLFAILTLSIVMTFGRRDIVISLLAFLASLSVLGLFELSQLLKIFILPFGFAKNIGFNPIGSVNDVGVLLAFGLVIVSGLMSSFEISKFLKRFLLFSVFIFILNLIIIDFWAIWAGLSLAMVLMISFLSARLSKSDRSPISRGLDAGLQETSDFENYQGLQLAYFQKAWLPSIIFLIALFLLFIPSPFSKFVQTPIEISPSFSSTLSIALANLKAGHYLLGSGPNTFGYIFNLYKPGGINQTIFWSTVFNSGAGAMATLAGTVGIFGILSLLFLIAAFIWTGISLIPRIEESAEGGGKILGINKSVSQTIFIAVIFMFAMWFLYVVNITLMAFTFWGMGLFLAASLLIPRTNSKINSKEIRIFTSAPKTFIFSLLIVALMTGAVIGIYFEADRYIAEIYFAKADHASAIRFWQYDERYFQSLSQAVFSQLNDLLAKKDLPQETLRAQFQNISANAVSAARQAQNLNPQNSFNSVLLGSIYENLIPFIADASGFALSAYGGAVSLDPQNPSNYLALARVEISKNELDKAVFNLEKSLKLKNDYAPARFLLVQVFDRQGKLADAVKKAEELVTLNNTDVGALFQLGFLYYKNSQFNESRQVFERTVQLSPNYSNARYFLGLIYDRNGDKTSAISQFVQIESLNPDNNEIKLILKNLKINKPALFGIAPPAPQNRAEAPVSETKPPVQKLKK
ncbi:MAG: tetratricopeptide repeat protein [Patescibacteria group bacterium]